MWRYRQQFVDVVDFRCARAGIFQLEYGCTLRQHCQGQPRPVDCIFRYQPALGAGLPDIVFCFADTEEIQLERLQQINRLLGDTLDDWFSNFSSIEAAIKALDGNRPSAINKVANCSVGSSAYLEARSQLVSLVESPK